MRSFLSKIILISSKLMLKDFMCIEEGKIIFTSMCSIISLAKDTIKKDWSFHD